MKQTSIILLLLSLFSSPVYLSVIMANPTEITTLNEFQRAINSNKPTVLLFYAPWCNACTTMKPIFKSSAQKYGDKAQFLALDVTKDELKDAIDTFGIQGVPTLCYKEIGLKTSEQFNSRLANFLGQPTPSKKPIKKPIKRSVKQSAKSQKTRTLPRKRASK